MQNNWGIIGHEWAVQTLASDIVAGHIRHAYLLLGPQGVGKTTLALALAQALLCGVNPPCADQRCCTLVAHHTHPDLTILEPEVSGKVIRTARINVEAVRELIYALNLKPVESTRRVALVLDFDSALDAAANALLKTLEEPPDNTVLILTAQYEDRLLPTITSRCERLLLRPLPVSEVAHALTEHWQVEPTQSELLAHLSGGRLGWAVQAANDPDLLDHRQQALSAMQMLITADTVTRFAQAEQLAADREHLLETLEIWLGWWRDLLLLSSGSNAPLLNIDHQAELKTLAEAFTPQTVATTIGALRTAQQHLSQNANARLVAEVLMLDLPKLTLSQ